MGDFIISSLTPKERGTIERIARQEASRLGVAMPSVEEMALELLRSHLVLIRDCGAILPAAGRPRAAKFKGRSGVSLSGGGNGRRT